MKPSALKPEHEFLTHSWNVFGVCFSPDGHTMAAATLENQEVSLIDTCTWKLSKMLPEPNFPPRSMEFSPDSKDLTITFGQEEPMCCWSVATGQLKWSLPKTGKWASYSPDGTLIATTKSKSILLLEARTGKLLHQFDGHRSPVIGTIFSSLGNRVASAGKSQLYLWDVINRTSIRLVQEKQGEINKAVFSPSGAILAVISLDGGVRLYDGQTGVFIRETAGHEDMVWEVVFTGDGKLLLTAGFDHKVRIWDAATGKEVRAIETPEAVSGGQVELSPDNTLFAVPMGHPVREVHIFRVATGELLVKLPIIGTGNPNSAYPFKASRMRWSFHLTENGWRWRAMMTRHACGR